MASLTERSDNKDTELAVLKPIVKNEGAEAGDMEPPTSFWNLFFCGSSSSCCKSVCIRFKSIFQRRPSSLHPLDGLRAIAVLLVIGCHSLEPFQAKIEFCDANFKFIE